MKNRGTGQSEANVHLIGESGEFYILPDNHVAKTKTARIGDSAAQESNISLAAGESTEARMNLFTNRAAQKGRG